MIVAVTSNEKSLSSNIEGVFGKNRYIFVADTERKIVKIIDNKTYTELKEGSDIKTAELLIKLNVKKVATCEISKEASEILKESGIEVFTHCNGTIQEILDHFVYIEKR